MDHKKGLDRCMPLVYIAGMRKAVALSPSKLVRWRKKNGYSQIRLGKALGVSTITVYRWEKGMRGIPPFLHLALKYLETEGGSVKEQREKGAQKTSMKGGKPHGKDQGSV